jgi:hypothetical protein
MSIEYPRKNKNESNAKKGKAKKSGKQGSQNVITLHIFLL